MKYTFGSRPAPACVPHLKLGDAGGADDLLGRNAVGLVGVGAHELDPAAGDDVGLEALGPQIGQQFQHRLIDQLGVAPLHERMFGRRDPLLDDFSNSSVVMPACVATMISACPSRPGREPPSRRPSAPTRTAPCLSTPDAGSPAPPPGRGEQELGVHRLLGPQRAVLVERGDPFGRRHEFRPALFGHLRDEADDRLLRGPSFHEGSGSVPARRELRLTHSAKQGKGTASRSVS